MFTLKFTMPELDDIYVQDFEIGIDIYKNLRARLVVKSSTCDNHEIVSILKNYDKVTLILNDSASFDVTPGYARIIDTDNLELYFFGSIANLYKKFGYYTDNGSGLIDYTTIDDLTNEPTGVHPIWLANEVLKDTNFKLSYAPSLDEEGRMRSSNKIYIRGEWLNRAEWMYEIAKNCFYYDYVGPAIVHEGISYVPDFTTDNTDNGKLNDCCNVLYDTAGNISIGIAGCQYMGNNKWRKIKTDITQFVLNTDDTVYKFIEFDNAVVQGNELSNPLDDSKKRTYLAKPLDLRMLEVFNTNYNRDNYDFAGLSGSDAWSIQTDGLNRMLQCESYRSGDRNFVVYDFATIEELVTSTKLESEFSVDVSDVSGSTPPWPAQEADRFMLLFQIHRMGLFFNLQYPYYEGKSEEERKKQYMDGYFFCLEMITDPIKQGYIGTPLETPQDLGRLMLHELFHTVVGLESSNDLHVSHTYPSPNFWDYMVARNHPWAPYRDNPSGCADDDVLLDYYYDYLCGKITQTQYRTIVRFNEIPYQLMLDAIQFIPSDKFYFYTVEAVENETWEWHEFVDHNGNNVRVPWPKMVGICMSPNDYPGTAWYAGGWGSPTGCSIPVTLSNFSNSDTEYQFQGYTHELYLAVFNCMNMFDNQEENYNDFGNSLTIETTRRLARILIDKSTSKLTSIPRTIKIKVVPVYTNGIVTKYDFTISSYPVTEPSRITSTTFSHYRTDIVSPLYLEGKAGLFTWARYPNEAATMIDMEDQPYPFMVRFDNFKMTCQSETLYGNVNKPIIMQRDRSINNNTQGVMVAKALLETQNKDKDIIVKVDPLLFFEKGITVGQWVTITYPYSIAGEHRVCSINITPDDVEFCLNHSDVRFIDKFDGIRKSLDVLDSF